MKKFIKPFSVAAISALILIIFAFGYVLNLKDGISENILRLHIVGASNSDYDQYVKLCVRDRILGDFSEEFAGCNSAKSAADKAELLKADIEAAARDELLKHGCAAEAAAAVEECKFPTKSYGGITLPGGEYTALNIKIGSAQGRNWWCVMYPPLCITDKSIVMPERSMQVLKNTLSDEEYRLISNSQKPDIKIKFRIAEILGKYFE